MVVYVALCSAVSISRLSFTCSLSGFVLDILTIGGAFNAFSGFQVIDATLCIRL